MTPERTDITVIQTSKLGSYYLSIHKNCVSLLKNIESNFLQKSLISDVKSVKMMEPPQQMTSLITARLTQLLTARLTLLLTARLNLLLIRMRLQRLVQEVSTGLMSER